MNQSQGLSWTEDELSLAVLQVLLAANRRRAGREVSNRMLKDILAVSIQSIQSTRAWLAERKLIDADLNSDTSVINEHGLKYLHERLGSSQA